VCLTGLSAVQISLLLKAYGEKHNEEENQTTPSKDCSLNIVLSKNGHFLIPELFYLKINIVVELFVVVCDDSSVV